MQFDFTSGLPRGYSVAILVAILQMQFDFTPEDQVRDPTRDQSIKKGDLEIAFHIFEA